MLFKVKLLNLDSCACLFELSLSSLSVVSRNLLLNSLGSAVNELLSFLQAKAGDLTDSLDDVDLSSAGRSKDNVELSLLLSSSSAALIGSTNSNSRSSGKTVSLLNSGDELGKLDNGKGVKSL